jgi:hypothetical protein
LSFFTKSWSEAAATAFSLASSLTACGDLSNTTQSCPFLMSRRTMLAPILPSPIIPSCIIAPLDVGNIDVNPTRTSPLGFSHLFTQAHKVGRQNGRRDFYAIVSHTAFKQRES